jgi:hypothetical protein
MEELRSKIRGCPEPMILPDVGHSVQEHGEPIARAALSAFGDDGSPKTAPDRATDGIGKPE